MIKLYIYGVALIALLSSCGEKANKVAESKAEISGESTESLLSRIDQLDNDIRIKRLENDGERHKLLKKKKLELEDLYKVKSDELTVKYKVADAQARKELLAKTLKERPSLKQA